MQKRLCKVGGIGIRDQRDQREKWAGKWDLRSLLGTLILYNKRIRYFYFVTVVLAEITTSDMVFQPF